MYLNPSNMFKSMSSYWYLKKKKHLLLKGEKHLFIILKTDE